MSRPVLRGEGSSGTETVVSERNQIGTEEERSGCSLNKGKQEMITLFSLKMSMYKNNSIYETETYDKRWETGFGPTHLRVLHYMLSGTISIQARP